LMKKAESANIDYNHTRPGNQHFLMVI